MAGETGPNPGPEHRTETPPEAGGTRSRAAGFLAMAAGSIADALVDPRILLAWFLSFVGAPSLVGLLVPVREGVGLLALALAARTLGTGGSTWARAVATAFRGLAAFGIAVAGLLFWGTVAGWTILALLLLIALAAPASDAPELAERRSRRVVAGTGAVGAIAFALVLLFELGPRGALVIWALMAAGGLWLLAALLVATLGLAPAAPTRAASPGLARLRADARLRRLALARLMLVPAALAPPYLVALVSVTPGRGLAALGSLLLASALAQLLTGPVLSRLAGHTPGRLAGAAAMSAAALALAALADAAGWLLSASWLLPLLVFALVAADGAARLEPATATAPLRTATALALLAGALFAPLAAAIGVRGVLLVQAAILLLAIPAALRVGEAERA